MTATLSNLYDRILRISRYNSVVDRNRAAMIYAILLVVIGIMTSYAVLVRQWNWRDGEVYTLVELLASVPEAWLSPVMLAFLSLYLFGAVTFIATRSGNLELGSWALIVTWFGGGAWLNLLAQESLDAAGIALILALLLAALLKQIAGLIATMALSLVSIALILPLRADDPFFIVGNVPTLVLSIISAALVLYLFLRYFRLSVSQGVVEAIEERIRASEIIASLSVTVADRVSAEQLAQEITRLMIDKFNHIYQARVYLIDSSSGEARLSGETIDPEYRTLPLQQAQRASVGGLSSIGQVASRGEALAVQLPEHIVEVILPMRLGRQITGVLNLRSTRLEYFDQPTVIAAFQALADSLALALDSARQHAEAEEHLHENTRLKEQMYHNLREIEKLNRNLTGTAWAQFLRSGGIPTGLDVEFGEQKRVATGEEWTQTLNEAMTINQFVQDEEDTHQIVAIPLRVRGQVIGAMEFELDARHEFTSEDYDLMQEVSERFGLAVENNRLVRESQRIAQRETFINQLSARLQAANDVQTALSTAAEELLSALNAAKVSIRLGEPADLAPEGTHSDDGGQAES